MNGSIRTSERGFQNVARHGSDAAPCGLWRDRMVNKNQKVEHGRMVNGSEGWFIYSQFRGKHSWDSNNFVVSIAGTAPRGSSS